MFLQVVLVPASMVVLGALEFLIDSAYDKEDGQPSKSVGGSSKHKLHANN